MSSGKDLPGFRCVGCGITVCADTDPDNYAPGETREQLSQRRCTACYRLKRSNANA